MCRKATDDGPCKVFYPKKCPLGRKKQLFLTLIIIATVLYGYSQSIAGSGWSDGITKYSSTNEVGQIASNSIERYLNIFQRISIGEPNKSLAV
jgi:hypothetical protein